MSANEHRRTVIQLLGGAAVLAGAYFAWRSLMATQEHQITERFTRAVDQLGSEKLEVRLGGIYALERIAKDSPKDHWTVMEVLTAYVREKAKWSKEKEATELPLWDNGMRGWTGPEETQQHWRQNVNEWCDTLPRLATDMQAVLTVLGRRETAGEPEGGTLDLSGTDLRRANLIAAHLERAYLLDVHLEGAALQGAALQSSPLQETYLFRAHLEGADLTNAHLEGGARKLGEAHLEGADLTEAHLEGAWLVGAHLEGADLSNAHLEGAILYEAQLNEETWFKGTHLEGADLSAVYGRLTQAQIDLAIIDKDTKLRDDLQNPAAKA